MYKSQIIGTLIVLLFIIFFLILFTKRRKRNHHRDLIDEVLREKLEEKNFKKSN